MSDYPSSRIDPPARLQGRYHLAEHLGAGGMSVVYRAHDETLGRDVAIKFLALDRVVGEEASLRFLREAQAVARLSHPNIMTIYDVGREDAWHYLVLEYIPGKDLFAALIERGGPLPVGVALGAARGVLEALAYAHGQDIIHRDIKPQNIMLTPTGQVKLMDFGLALGRDDVRLTGAGTVVGTMLYVAPELISGAALDRRADLYAVGAVLYELLTGTPPYTGDSLQAILSQILSGPLTPPRQINPHIPPAAEQLVLRLLAKDPEARYGSAEEALADLNKLADRADPGAGETALEPSDLSLLERIVRGSSSANRLASAAPATEESLIEVENAPPELAQELLLYAAQEDTAAAVESERRRLARLLESNVVDSLNLLISQAAVYEQTMGGNPQARMAASVLASLARQVLQQTRDLGTSLNPTILETLGLEPALEALASQAIRTHGLHVSLEVERMRERLPTQIELALFRAAQDALDQAIHQTHASQVTIRLERDSGMVVFRFSDNGTAGAGMEALRAARQRIRQMGGSIETRPGSEGGLELTIMFRLAPPVQLTPREIETLRLLAAGLSNKQIAAALSISPRTVNFHLDNIYSKLGVSSRTEAAIYALRQGLIRRSESDPG